jgi:hypothetical protein
MTHGNEDGAWEGNSWSYQRNFQNHMTLEILEIKAVEK